MKSQISIVVTCYNFELYIAECIESLLRQTLKPLEIIICDDASTDASPQIIQKLADENPKAIRPFLHSKNMGMNANTLFGASKIRGDLCCLIDGDDRFHPLKLALEYEAMAQFPEAAIAYSNIATINPKGQRTSTIARGGPTPPSGFILPHVFGRTVFPGNMSLYRHELMRCSALEDIGWIDDEADIYSDWDMRLRLAAKFPVVYVKDALVDYRLHDTGMHNSEAKRRLAAVLKVHEKNEHLLDDYPKAQIAWAKTSALKFIQKLRDEVAGIMPESHRKLVIQI